jgi:HAD superfamily hydrolase (TIGR01458 family)
MSTAKNFTGNIKGFLIDIDGVLYTGKERIAGAIKTINYLKRYKIPFLLATNTTRKSRYSLQSYLYSMGFKVNIEQIYSATYAARQWLIAHKIESIYLFLRGDAYREFKGFRVTANNPECIVLGDLGEDLTYNKLNHAFQLIMGGTKMLALQKNRYWNDGSDLVIDAGAIVAALEYATQKKAIIIGKPQKDFFKHALRELNLPSQDVAIIGDDLENDIKGGKQAGLFAIAVQTGKFTKEALMSLNVRPDLLMQSIADLPDWIEENRKLRRNE